jgi:two-component system cell cycle response regulator DivK
MTARVLVVEDTPANMKLVTMLLTKEGYEVLQARTAENAIAIAQEQALDLIVMDLHLPGMDGLEATSILKADERTRAVPVIAVTAMAMHGDEERVLAAGCDGYVAKPIRYKEFLKKVANMLDAHSAGAA